jgi:TolB-like protein/AraC-like DNA-binding protein/Tfp pilus assembly protein PilF
MDNDFLSKVTGIILENLSNEQFGVSELARATSMSRSNLLRKIKKLSKLSASQFINQVRLQQAMEMLKQSSLNVSEVGFEVGFSSTSYFIKCFREYYGYPPGEVGKRDMSESGPISTDQGRGKIRILIPGLLLGVVLFTVLLLIVFKPISLGQKELEKSIAVLPFINDSNDSANVYIINGLMESVLNNLMKIKDLRVISRTSVEKYRNAPKTIPEMGCELNVNYFVEGSGQKIGDQILLNVQLIEAPGDKHLWAEQYSREAKDIFKLQQEVAKSIARQVQAIITPKEEERIDKIPTDDLVAYDYYLKGLDYMNRGNREGLEEAIPWFNKAIAQDDEFAHAYAHLAISYYYLDIFQTEKKYSDQINYNADQALLFDPHLAQGLVAKALYYINNKEYEQAVPYLEKALEYNPNSARVINVLADFYTNVMPNTEKYLEYALKGIRLDIAAQDSVTASYTYLHVSNAFIQSGFVDEAKKYINKSLEYNPENLYSEYVKAYILYAKDKDLRKTKKLLIKALNKDTTRLDILQEVAKINYYQRDYEGAYRYYKRFIETREAYQLDIYRYENAKIGLVLSKMGMKEKSDSFFVDYKVYAENDRSLYKHLSLAMYYSYKGNTEKALEELELFSQQDNYAYWTILFLKIDPLIDSIKDLPETRKLLNEMETKFWDHHRHIKATLEERGLI